MRYRLLGPTRALRADGTPYAVGGTRLRALLTVLALRPGRTVPAATLVDEVWDGDTPVDAAGALQALVSRLRRALGAGTVVADSGGYRLCADRDDVDLYRFERLTAEGIRALDDGGAERAAELLDEALGLWHGPALTDLPDRRSEAARWEARRLGARRARLTAALALGRAEEALPELAALCDDHPIDELLQALRIRALRAVGRTAEALSAYDEVRRDLATRLGMDPGPELRTLHKELLNPDAYANEDGTWGRGRAGPRTDDGSHPAGGAPGGDDGSPGSTGATAEPDSYGEGAAPAPSGAPTGPVSVPDEAGHDAGPGSARPGGAGGPTRDASGSDGAAAEPASFGEGAASASSGAQTGPVPVPDSEAHAGPGPDGAAAEPGSYGEGAASASSGAQTGPVPVRDGAAHGSPALDPDSAGHAGPGSAGAPVEPASFGEGAASAPSGAPTGPVPVPDGAAHAGSAEPAPAGAGPGSPLPGNLRARINSFVGREADMADLREDLRDARLVTLFGAGGAGKTRLSQEVAAGGGGGAWPDGVWLAELAPVDDPATVPEAVLVALGARETVLRGAGAESLRAVDPGANDPLVRLVEHCSRRRMLLLLDNCEHVVDAAARLVEELLARCPGVTVLATSREPLGVPGEVVRPVGPLPEPMALRLLADRGAAARPGFRTDEDPGAADEICRRLDGLPLAIELAAARLRMLTPRQIADRLDDRFRLLTGGSRTVLPRQQTLRAVVDWSWDLLDPAERTALGALSVFAGGCDLAAAEALCGPDALELLGSLVDKSLVIAAPAPDGEMRYRLLETVLEYAGERLDESGEGPAAERRHLVHFRELARRADLKLRGPEQVHSIARITLEYENMRTALRRAVADRDEQEALCLVHSLAFYWQIRDLRSDARHWSSAAAELGPDPFAAPVVPAPPVYDQCTDAPPPMAPDVLMEARRGVRLIHLASMNHEFDEWTTPEAMERLRRISEVYEPGLPQICRTPGSLWFFAVMITGQAGRLRELIDARVRACRDFGYEWELASALQVRANILANRTEWVGDAGRDADESLEIFTRLGDAWGAAEALSARAEAHERNGEFARATEDFLAAIETTRLLGVESQVALLRTRLAGVMMETGEGDEAEAVLREILRESRRDYEAEPAARIYLAIRLGRTGRSAEGRHELGQLREEFKHSNLRIFEGFVFGLLGWLENLDTQYGAGLDWSRRALELSNDAMSRIVAPQMSAVHLLTAGWALAGLGGPERVRDGARLIGAYEAHLPRGHYRASHERENREAAEAAVRAGGLDGAAYEEALAEGRALTLDEAFALAGV
ncbi:BTAD domain-containing putative transcriptional regulator [Streptomyces sp. NP-1717]|uniref:AfsR/SARP family transcriptional regulator n=1 Tax=Streptomyces sp. NP-1717 TaxID=2704470 RepID=UPI001F5D3680|nr:BTAD domain-containing putative transcriptional regulator [Streptomyces sp. NP-1717]MCI3225766.1 AfsR/SARP family transcriptional regulator [Streptomyces sp. NP-1717]